MLTQLPLSTLALPYGPLLCGEYSFFKQKSKIRVMFLLFICTYEIQNVYRNFIMQVRMMHQCSYQTMNHLTYCLYGKSKNDTEQHL